MMSVKKQILLIAIRTYRSLELIHATLAEAVPHAKLAEAVPHATLAEAVPHATLAEAVPHATLAEAVRETEPVVPNHRSLELIHATLIEPVVPDQLRQLQCLGVHDFLINSYN
jgi:hypothetical protein